MRWLRLIYAIVRASFRSKLSINDTSMVHFSVWLTDVDASIMNHAAMLTVFEAGRLDYIQRVGFLKLVRKNKWYFASSAISVQFLRPLKVFQRAVITTKLLYVSDHYIYTEQKITRNGKDIAICITKGKAKLGKVDVHTDEIVASLHASNKPTAEKELIDCYEKSNALFREKICE